MKIGVAGAYGLVVIRTLFGAGAPYWSGVFVVWVCVD